MFARMFCLFLLGLVAHTGSASGQSIEQSLKGLGIKLGLAGCDKLLVSDDRWQSGSRLWGSWSAVNDSMLPNIEAGDFLIAISAKTPTRGDPVLFWLPKHNQTVMIRRVIGLPGERIYMSTGRLWINEELIERKVMEKLEIGNAGGQTRHFDQFTETLPNGRRHKILEMTDSGGLDNTQVYVVPDKHFFAMGDNRDNSLDSRLVDQVGFVPFENLIGTVACIVPKSPE